ncbi:unnamed protein product [Closterium sp. NIES-53]
MSRCPAGCRVALLLPVALPCWLSRRPAAACLVALPCPRAALLVAAPPYPACASPFCPHRPSVRRPAARATRMLPTLLRAALLVGALLPARRPAGSRTALRWPPPPSLRAAVLVAPHSALPTMASLSVLTFDHEGRLIQYDTWLDDLQLYLLSGSLDSVSLFDHTSGAPLAPPCHAFVACTPASLFLVFPGLCLPSRPRLPCPAFLASRGGSAPLLTPPRFPRRLLPCRHSTWTCGAQSASADRAALLPSVSSSASGPARTRGGEFSSDLLRDFCRGEGIFRSFTLPASPQQNGVAERRIGLVMEVARTSMIHAAAPHFLWPFAVRYAVHQLNLWPHVSLPETLPTLRWTGKFYHPTSRRVLPSQDVTFDELVPFYHLFPYRAAPLPTPPLFFAPGPPPVDPLPPQGPAPSGMSQVDPLPLVVPVKVAVDSGAARGAAFGGATSGGAEPGGAELEGAEREGAESERAESGGAEPEGAEPGGAEPKGTASNRDPSGGAGGASPRGARTSGTGAPGAGGDGGDGAGDPGAGGNGAGDPRPGGPSAVGAGAGGTGAGDARAGHLGAEEAGAGGAGAGGTRAGGAGAGGARARGTRAGGAGAGGAGAGGAGAGGTGSPLPAPSPYAEQTDSLTERREPESRPASPIRAGHTGRCVPRPRPPPVPGTHIITLLHAASPTVPRLLATVITDPSFDSATASALVAELLDFAAACRLDYATSLVAESESDCPPSVEGECALGTDVLEDKQEDFECLAAVVPHLVAMLLAPEGDPDAPDIPTPRFYAEAITGPYSSQWQRPMDAEMASWKSTRTYVDAVPPLGANIVDGMWIFRVKRPPGSPPVFKARYVARGFSQRLRVDFFQTFSPSPKMTTLRILLHVAAQRDYELHSLDFSTAFLQGSLHEEIWLRRPLVFTGSFLAGTQWSLRRPVYGLHQAPREWHDTLRTTLAALGFAPSTADPSLFLRTDTSLPPFYVLVYVNDLVFATADTEALALVKSFNASASGTPLPTGHSLLAPSSDESVEPSGLCPELVGCLITSGMGLVLGGWGPVVLTGHANASWVDELATQRSSQGYTFSLGSGSVSWQSTRSSSILSSSCEAEIYVGAMATQELRWLTYLLTDLGERPRSSPFLYVDKKAMISLCQEHRTKHITLRYFLARELQQHGQLRLAYMATRANTADIFTKALQSGDHLRFCTVLGLVPILPHLLTA